MARILVVEDEKTAREALVAGLASDKHVVTATRDAEEALEVLRDRSFDLVLSDLVLPGMDGFRFMRQVRGAAPQTSVVIMTGFGSVDTAVRAMKEGAYDYITKPLRMKEVCRTVDRALEVRALLIENSSLRARLGDRFGSGSIVGFSESLRKALSIAEQVAPSRSTVLLTGESGTGKDLLARTIHQASGRPGRFVPVNCAALPESLLEAELFGHEKGAFTGALRQKEGRFQLADGGTLFLDEVGDLSPPTQAKLLRVLQEGEFEMVGGTKTLKVDVRIVAATNVDLKLAIAERRFREDLFYRLNVVSIRLPALRERREDIPLLVNHFVRKYARENGKAIEEITSRALDLLRSLPWPGNLRELENAIEHAVVMTRSSRIDVSDLPETIQGTAPADPESSRDLLVFKVGTPLEEIENEAIVRTLEHLHGDKDATAARLGIAVATLYRKLRKIATT
ncbi:MAG: sigma-54 dependent transcriptional regulator [Acidobacteriota bacterium]